MIEQLFDSLTDDQLKKTRTNDQYSKNRFLFTLVIIFCCAGANPAQDDYAHYVNPFIGTGGHGHTFPGATTPFGLVQLSPDAGTTGWDWCSGYHYSDSSLIGFSHTHLSGTGVGDLGDVLVMAYTGDLMFQPGSKENPDEGFRSRFSHDNEIAEPGYYSVYLQDYDVQAELTATSRTGLHRYTFPVSKKGRIVFDLKHAIYNRDVLESEIEIIDESTITGYRAVSGWPPIRFVYFVAEFSRPFTERVLYWSGRGNTIDYQKDMRQRKAAGAHGVVLTFEQSDEPVLVKVGLSSVEKDGALTALDEELDTWDFDAVKKQARDTWNRELGKIDIEGTQKQKEIFYTGLYRNFISPHQIANRDGRYIGPDFKVHQAKNKKFYSTFSLWDTYRATHPLYTLVQQERVPEMVQSLLAGFDATGHLPLWALWGGETNCMIGNHSVPVIVDAWLKDISGFDAERAYQAIKMSLTKDHFKSPWTLYDKFGYIPCDRQRETISRLLEFCFNDWCAAQMAEALGHSKDAEFFLNRSQNYRNVFDEKTGFMRGRLRDGSWKTPFNPYKMDWALYTEATAWQYTWYVPHNVYDLIDLMGGDDAFISKLDSLFVVSSDVDESVSDITGLIGQYAHGNEPSHHIAYLYNYAGVPWKTQQRIRTILQTQYNNTPDGYSGNEDCGQMSAWYVFSSMGLYPVNPCGGVYVFGSPLLDKATIHLNGNRFDIVVKNQHPDHAYIQSVTFNGEPYKKTWIHHNDMAQGGTLEFEMGGTPNKEWGREEDARPPQR